MFGVTMLTKGGKVLRVRLLFVSLAGIGAWHVTGDRSNAGGVVGSVAGAPGTTDEVFLAAQEAAQAHRDSQGRLIHIIFY